MVMVLRRGSRGENVKKLQKILNSVLPTTPKLTEDGIYGAGTLKAVMEFQKSAGLIADGVVGKKTWSALSGSGAKSQPKKRFNSQAPLADIAAKYLGVKETGDNLAGKSKELLAIFEADDLAPNGKTDGYPWCAAFVSFCVQKFVSASPYYDALIPPRQASVSRFLNIWAKSKGCTIFNNKSSEFEPRKGDIVVFIFSHIGIVENVNGSVIKTIEGNTNDAGSREGTVVARKNRNKKLIKSYIRLPLSTSKLMGVVDDVAGLC